MRRFSRRTGWDTTESHFSESIRVARLSGREVIDLTVSNPTVCGFEYDAAGILGALADPALLIYDANPMGMHSARVAVCEYYAGHQALVEPGDVLLTTSTSE